MADQQRLVIGYNLCRQGHDEQDGEDDRRPVATAVGLEIMPAPPGDRAFEDAVGKCHSRVLPPLKINARIDQRIGQVTDQMDHQPQQREEIQRGKHNRVIPVHNRLETEQA